MSGKKNNSAVWIIASAILLVVLFYMFFMSSPIYNWSESYSDSDELPYGSSVFKGLVERRTADDLFYTFKDSIERSIDIDTLPEASNYVVIGRELYLDSAETDFLMQFVRNGHNAFIYSRYFTGSLIDTLMQVEYEYDWYENISDERPLNALTDTSITLNLYAGKEVFEHPVACTYVRDNTPLYRSWMHFRENIKGREFEEIEVLGYFNGYYANYVRIPYGKGYFYLHSTPLAFTNYHLLNEENFNYVNNSIAWMGDGAVLWDDYNRNFQWEGAGNASAPGYEHDDGPLAFILSERSLRWAWFILLGIGLLYLLFGARRRQRPIKVVHGLSNTSVDFAETIGTMFRMEKDHRKLTRLKMRLFKAHIRERYKLRVPAEGEPLEPYLERLSERSHVPLEELKNIFSAYDRIIGRDDPDGRGLVIFHGMLRDFYAKAR